MTSTQLPTRRGLRLRGAEILLWAAIASSVAFGLSAILGPNGLGLMTMRPEWPVIGQSAYEMSIETPFNDDAGISVANAPRWKDTSDGTRGRRHRRPTGGDRRTLQGTAGFLNPTFAMQWAWIYWQAAGPLAGRGGTVRGPQDRPVGAQRDTLHQRSTRAGFASLPFWSGWVARSWPSLTSWCGGGCWTTPPRPASSATNGTSPSSRCSWA